MANLTVKGNPLGSGTFTVEPPNSNTSRTITLPDATTTLVGTDTAQTLTNKTIQGGALTLATAQASTSGTNIDFTGIPSWARRVTVMFSGVSTNGASGGLIQLGAGSFETTGYTAQRGSMFSNTSYGSLNATSGFPWPADVASAAASGALTLILLGSNTWVATGVFAYTNTSPNPNYVGGAKTISGTLDRIRVTTTNGTDTFDAGSINIMYEG